ncbi:MAG: hypothetical protein ACJ76Z_09810 [Thermoleophilaceae bacterium]
MGAYVVCTECEFLRVRGENAHDVELPKQCPNCGADLVLRDDNTRFEPTYVSRVARALQRARL